MTSTASETNATRIMGCDSLVGRLRDICRGHDDAGNPVLTPRQCNAYRRHWGLDDLPNEQSSAKDHVGKIDTSVSIGQHPTPTRNIPKYIDRTAPCVHLGEVLRVEACQLCGQSGKTEEVHACPIRGECTRKAAGLTVTGGKRLMTVCLSCTNHSPKLVDPDEAPNT